jgi:hypothetical protein
VRVPAALEIARAIDTLSVATDPASLALTQVTAEAGMFIGLEREVFVFPEGRAPPPSGRRSVVPSVDFTANVDTWTTGHDGIPAAGTRYAVEVRFALIETDVPPAEGWKPDAGSCKTLWSRTLRQTEE